MQRHFKDDVAEVRASLAARQDDLLKSKQEHETKLGILKRECKEESERLIKEEIPDIREATIRRLRKRRPEFFSQAVEAWMHKADLRLTLRERWSFQADTILAIRNPGLRSFLLREFATYIEHARPAPEGFEQIALARREISARENLLAETMHEMDEIQRQLAGLVTLQKSALNGSFARLNPRVVKSVSVSAQRLRDMRKNHVVESRKLDESNPSDDGFSIIDLWLLSQLLNSGSHTGSQAEEVFRGGHGLSGGAGAEASFDADVPEPSPSRRVSAFTAVPFAESRARAEAVEARPEPLKSEVMTQPETQESAQPPSTQAEPTSSQETAREETRSEPSPSVTESPTSSSASESSSDTSSSSSSSDSSSSSSSSDSGSSSSSSD